MIKQDKKKKEDDEPVEQELPEATRFTPQNNSGQPSSEWIEQNGKNSEE